MRTPLHRWSWVAFLSGLLVVAGSDPYGSLLICPEHIGVSAPLMAVGLDKHTEQLVASAYGKLPYTFEANQGQTNGQVRFLARRHGYRLSLTSTEAVLSLASPQGTPRRQPVGRGLLARSSGVSGLTYSNFGGRYSTEPPGRSVAVRMRLVGANSPQRVVGRDELPGKVNYLIGNDRSKWRTHVPTYARVLYENVYPGINVIYYGTQGNLEYDIVVAPGADPKNVRLAFEGANRIELDGQGHLVLHTDIGQVLQHRPKIYQEVNGVRNIVSGGYVLDSKGEVGFQIATYDRSKPLVIDPVLVYSTYLGGGDLEGARGIAVDGTGSAYIVGETSSFDFPIAGGVQPIPSGATDVFVTKLNPAGTDVVYSTYLGGSFGDRARKIAVDAATNAYVTGGTSSPDFPTTATALQPTFGGERDGFVAKLNPSGSGFDYSTYLGGSRDDEGSAIATDASGNAYVTGLTASIDFPTATPLQSAAGAFDAFVAKVNPTGSALVYSTYLGGTGTDQGFGLALDGARNAYVSGLTTSTNFPTANPLQPTSGGRTDAFVTKLNPAGSALLYSTYLGGDGLEAGFALATDTLANAYVTGTTSSLNFPTRNPLQPTLGGDFDAFVAKLNPAGAALIYSTYLGGRLTDQALGIGVDASGNAYVAGGTASVNFPTTDSVQSTLGSPANAFLAKLNSAASALVYSTYLGGTTPDAFDIGMDEALAVAVESSGNVYITGRTLSTNFPTVNPFQTLLNGGMDTFVAKINSASTRPVISAVPTSEAFGNVNVGSSADRSFTIQNIGVSNLAGSASTAAPFSIVSGGTYSLGPAASQIVVVRFTPTAARNFPGAVSFTGGGGASRAVTGTGLAPTPTVSITPTSQSLGYVTVGSSAERAFTVQNVGVGTLTGSASTAAPFSIVSGAAYSLASGATQLVRVRFTPTAAGSSSGTVGFTGGGGATGIVTGVGLTPLTLRVTPTSQGFGNVNVGSSADRTFTVENLGMTTLTGSASSTAPFSVVSGGSYNLAPGASQAVVVRFNPTTAANFNATVSFTGGGGATRPVTGVGLAPTPTLSVTPGSLPFGVVTVGSGPERSFTVQNLGLGTLSGSASTAAPFSLVSGGAYSLEPGASQTVVVRFSPTAAGNFAGTVSFTGGAGAARSVTGVGVATVPTLSVTPSSHSFGTVTVGTSANRSFTVQNLGMGTLSGSASTLAPFSIVSGGSYSLGPGASQVVIIRFSPTVGGDVTGNVSFTGGAGATQPVTGLGMALSVTPSSHGFGTAPIGTSVDRTFTIQNLGSVAFTGTASTTAPFSIVSGGSYSLAGGASQLVVVRFTPSITGNFTGTVNFTGGGGGTRSVTGIGLAPTAMLSVTPSSEAFGNVSVGSAADRTFTVQNLGMGTLTGSASTTSPFSIVSGGAYTLAPGASQPVVVRFSPAAPGNFAAMLNFNGGGGASRSVSGIGLAAAPTLSVTPGSHAYDQVTVGSFAERTFAVQNLGLGTLAGTVSTALPFNIVSGGTYSLAPGATQAVVVRFSPTAPGNFTVAVNFTGGEGAGRLVTGVGLASTPTLAVTPGSHAFATSNVGTWIDRSFTVQNLGLGTLIGAASTAAPFTIVSGGSYSLGPGATQAVVVRFSPTVAGDFIGNLSFTGGSGATRPLTGTGIALLVTPNSHGFGNAAIGTSVDRTFTVQNLGSVPFTGTASTTAPFSIVSGGSYSLAGGASQLVVVRFTPSVTGNFTGTVSFTGGGGGTRSVTGIGLTTTPLLSVTPSSETFGNVSVGSPADRTFTVQNLGLGTLTGGALTTLPFSVFSGGAYTLSPGASQTVVVRFSPTAAGNFTGAVSFTGGAGAARPVTGIGLAANPTLSVTPGSEAFGGVSVGGAADRSFTVQNLGLGTLTGNASTAPPFSIVSGGAYSLAPGASQAVVVRFGPTAPGNFAFTVGFTGGGGASRPVTGVGLASIPTLSVTPTSHNYGQVTLGSSADRSFTVQNLGLGTLVGAASTVAPFGIVSGASYSLGPGATQTVVVRFGPTAPGNFALAVNFTGGGGAGRTVTGTGLASTPTLAVTPSSEAFGGVRVGSSADRSFTVQNLGLGTLIGSASTAAPFSIVSAGSYNLAAGTSQAVVVRFRPTAPGSFAGNINFSGAGGAIRSVTGAGVATTLVVDPTSALAGETVMATWANISAATATDWIGLYASGAPDLAYIEVTYVSCSQVPDVPVVSGSCPFTLPETLAPGTYELRLFSNDDVVRLAVSNPIDVTLP